MNRKIKFRGIASVEVFETGVKSGDMIFGQVVFDKEVPFIVGPVVESDEEYIALQHWCSIDPETLGQFTGLLDKNGKEIYEGDILRSDGEGDEDRCDYAVEYHAPEFTRRLLHSRASADWDVITGGMYAHELYRRQMYVIGNIYENPELINDTAQGGKTPENSGVSVKEQRGGQVA